MFEVKIKKNGSYTNSGKFKTLDDANEWILKCESQETFGPVDKWINEKSATPEQIADSDSFIEIDNPFPSENEPAKLKVYHIPKRYTVEINDITEQHNDQKVIDSALKRLDFGKQMLAKVFLQNKKNLAAGKLDGVKFNQLLNDVTLQKVERLLLNGSLETAKGLVASLDNTYFDASVRTAFANEIQDYLTKEGQV